MIMIRIRIISLRSQSYIRSFPGMVVRDFRGIPSIKEVECWGGDLDAEVKLLSLTMFRNSDNSVLAYVNPLTGECITFGEFSSCMIDKLDARKSKLRILVYDLVAGESVQYGCNATSFKSVAHTTIVTWSVSIITESE